MNNTMALNTTINTSKASANAVKNWGDDIYDSDFQKDARFVNMSPTDWKQCVKQHLSTCNDLKRAMAWVDRIEKLRPTTRVDTVEPEYAADLRLFQDMVTEPSKYGNDIELVLELEKALLQTPARWRVAAIWAREEQKDQLYLAASKIQAAVRGALTRKSLPAMDCARCLAHTQAYYPTSQGKICEACNLEDYYNSWSCDEHSLDDLDRESDYDREADDDPEWSYCRGCGCKMHIEDKDEYRPGFWCSRMCAYDLDVRC